MEVGMGLGGLDHSPSLSPTLVWVTSVPDCCKLSMICPISSPYLQIKKNEAFPKVI